MAGIRQPIECIETGRRFHSILEAASWLKRLRGTQTRIERIAQNLSQHVNGTARYQRKASGKEYWCHVRSVHGHTFRKVD